MSVVEVACTTTVRVRDLALLADIGINPDEIGRRQPLVISVELLLSVDPVRAIGETIDYRRIADAAESLAKIHIPLIETFAGRLGAECLAWQAVAEARISINKPFALKRGEAGVEVVLRRKEAPLRQSVAADEGTHTQRDQLQQAERAFLS